MLHFLKEGFLCPVCGDLSSVICKWTIILFYGQHHSFMGWSLTLSGKLWVYFSCVSATETLNLHDLPEVFHRMSENPESVEEGIAALEEATDPLMLSEDIIKRFQCSALIPAPRCVHLHVSQKTHERKTIDFASCIVTDDFGFETGQSYTWAEFFFL